MIVVIVPASQRSDRLRVVGDVFVDQSLLSVCAVQAFKAPIRLRMCDPGSDIARTGERHKRSPLATNELASMIMDELRLTGAAGREFFQRLLHGQHHEIRVHRHVECPMDEIPAIPVQDVDEVIPPWRDVQVH